MGKFDSLIGETEQKKEKAVSQLGEIGLSIDDVFRQCIENWENLEAACIGHCINDSIEECIKKAADEGKDTILGRPCTFVLALDPFYIDASIGSDAEFHYDHMLEHIVIEPMDD